MIRNNAPLHETATAAERLVHLNRIAAMEATRIGDATALDAALSAITDIKEGRMHVSEDLTHPVYLANRDLILTASRDQEHAR
jgi:hypothetical protein